MNRRDICLGLLLPSASMAGSADDALHHAMARAREMRALAERAGDQPYGAVVMQGERIVGEAPSRVVTTRNADAHAEREALRDAALRLRRQDLSGLVLVSTSRPCRLCEEAAAAAGITRMVFGDALASAVPVATTLATPAGNLIDAAARGDTALLRRLLDARANVNARDASGRNAVLAATQGGHIEAARLLIAAGADVNAQDAMQDSAFLLAGARGHHEIVSLALAAGADLKLTNRYGGTALIPACHYGHVETVRVLLQSKIDVNHINRLGWTALLEAVILGDGGPRHREIVRLLLAHGAQPNLADRDGVTPLVHARRLGQSEVAALLQAASAR